MTVKHLQGDLLSLKQGIIAHQENTFGVHGAGVALQLTKRYPHAMTAFANFTKQPHDHDLMGHVCLVNTDGSNGLNPSIPRTDVQIANMYGQNEIGVGIRQTDYNALKLALTRTHNWAQKTGQAVAVPALIGCGLAGGDWDNVVLPMLEQVFSDDVELLIYHFNG